MTNQASSCFGFPMSNFGFLGKLLPWVLFLFLFLPEHGHAQNQDVPARKSVRLALVSTGTNKEVANALDLVQAKLTDVAGIELLERSAIGKVLAEHQLSLSGLADANTAARVGELLSVDLFGVLETDPAGKKALGLVVYDAGNGVKLWDAALATGGLEKEVESIVAGVQTARARWNAGRDHLKTVCFLTVRNADLPPEMNSLCQALAAILERQLVSSSAIAVLERKRLDFVNKEKELVHKAAIKKLLSSLVLVELEVGRARSRKGLRATAFLTDHQGKKLAQFSALGPEDKIAKLVDPLLAGIAKTLRAASSPKAADPTPEASRFAHEALILLSHNLDLQALQAAESAYALDPANPDHAPLLGRCLAAYAVVLSNPKGKTTTYGGNYRIQVEPDKLKTTLRLARRSFDIRAGTLARLPVRNQKTLGMNQNRNVLVEWQQNIFRNHLQFYDPKAFDDEARELRAEVLAAMNRLAFADVVAAAELARKDPKTLTGYTILLLQRFGVLHRQSGGSADFAGTMDKLVRQWLDVSGAKGARRIQPAALAWFLDELEHFTLHPYPVLWKYKPADRDKLLALFKTMEGHRQPLIALCGRHGQLELRIQGKQIAAAEALKDFKKIVSSCEELIENPPPVSGDDFRISGYKLLLTMISNSTLHFHTDTKLAELYQVCDFMLKRQEIVYDVVQKGLWEGFYFPKHQKERFALVQRAVALLDSPRCRFLLGDRAFTQKQLLRSWQQIVTAVPELRPKTEVPWVQVHSLLKIAWPPYHRLAAVKVMGKHVYAVAAGLEEEKPFLQVVRVSLEGGSPLFLGKARVELKSTLGKFSEGSWLNFVTAMAVGENAVYVSTNSDGIYAFAMTGVPGRRIGTGEGLPTRVISALALLDGKLYAGSRTGHLMEYDPAEKRCTILASSQRKEKRSPFDDAPSFWIPNLVADPARQRVLFVLYQAGSGTMDGLWEFNAKTRAFKQHLRLYRHAVLDQASEVHNGRVFFTNAFNRLVVFDLAKNKAALLSEAYPIGPTLKIPDAEKRRQPFPAAPYLCHDGWVWTLQPFGRRTLDGSKRELFPPPGKHSELQPFMTQWMELVEGGNLFIGDRYELWVLKLGAR